ncbi:hypothetical protein AZ012_000001, partial [Citrobacter amalonaticus]
MFKKRGRQTVLIAAVLAFFTASSPLLARTQG